MNKCIYLLIIVLLKTVYSFSQVTFEGSEKLGRIFDLVYHPTIQNKIFAVSMGNHIVHSDDNGIDWKVFYSHSPNNQSVERLRFVDSNSISFNLKNGYFNNYLKILNIETNQIVNTFILPIPENSEKAWITDYAISPQDKNIAIVSQGYNIGFTSYHKVYYTRDGGNNWQTIYSSLNNNNTSVNRVAISPENASKLYIAKGNGPETPYGGLLISNDEGFTWEEELARIPIGAIAINPNDANDIIIGTDGNAEEENLFRSSDGGITWQNILVDWDNYLQNNINNITFNPNNVKQIMVLEENQVIITSDSFQTHTNTFFNEEVDGYYYGLNASYNPYNWKEVLVSANYHPLRSINSGRTFDKIDNPFFSSNNVQTFKINDDLKHLYYEAQYGYIHKDIFTGIENAYNLTPLNYTPNQISQFHADDFIIGRIYNLINSYSDNNLLISNNHGYNNVNIEVGSQHLYSVASQIESPNKIWASFYNEQQGNQGSQVYQYDFSNNNIIVQPIDLPYFDVVRSIFISPTDFNTKFIALGSRIYKTIDNGLTWLNTSNGLEHILNLTNDKIFKITNNPLNADQLSIATSRGIFTSLDNGNNWNQISTNIVENILHSSVNNGVIVANSYTNDLSDSNIYYSSNMGLDWHTVLNSDLHEPFVLKTDFHFFDGKVDIFLATSDLGVLKHTINFENLSVPNFNSLNKIIVYPNPTENFIYIHTKEAVSKIEIYDILGKKYEVNNIEKYKIDVTYLTKGIYTIKVLYLNGELSQTKFVKY